MNLGSKALIRYVLVIVIVFFVGISARTRAAGQTADQNPAPSDQKPVMAEDVFKNIQLLRGIPVKEFMDTMGFFSASTGMNCIDCHSPQAADSMAAYAIDTPLKQTTRKMILMVRQLNQQNFGGQLRVTCYTCHRATDRPKNIPSLADQYAIQADDPNEVEVVETPEGQSKPTNQVSPDQIINKYIAAVGGAAQLAKLTSFVAKGTYEGFDSYGEKVPIEMFAAAPDKLTTVIHNQEADSVSTFDGMNGWVAASDKLMRVLPLKGGDLEGAKLDASVSFPAAIKKDFTWQTGFPSVTINNHAVQVIQVAGAGRTGAKLYFDKLSGLLVRQVRYSDTAVGVIPSQVDYSDYRLVAGVKMPFHLVYTWTDGRSVVQLTTIQPNVRIDAARFDMPAPPKAKIATP
jgi:photosynthetic reaction center cytochrome c subunit